MSESITIARPYAKAAFDFANEKNIIEHWSAMLNIMAEVSKNDQMKNLVDSGIRSSQLAEIFITVCSSDIDEFGRNFVKIMADNHRLLLLPFVLKLFTDYALTKNQTVDVLVTSAIALSENQQNKIILAMEKKLTKHVNLISQIDKSVIAGFIIRVGDMVIDNSVKGRLERLSDTLQS